MPTTYHASVPGARLAGYLRHAGPGGMLYFATELLPNHVDSDRWRQALLPARHAEPCFRDACAAPPG